jgi:hypothetical protein
LLGRQLDRPGQDAEREIEAAREIRRLMLEATG